MERRHEGVQQKDEKSVDKEDVKKVSPWKINKTLLPLKMFYFFFYGASGSVIPFITVYLKHLQLSASETGLITGAAVFFAMSVRPLIGMVADHWSAWKSALIICCLGFGAAFFCLWFVPARTRTAASYSATSHSPDNFRPPQSHVGQRHRVWICRSKSGAPVCSFPAIHNLTKCQIFPEAFHETSSEIPQSVRGDLIVHVSSRPSLNDHLFTRDSDAQETRLESDHRWFDVNRAPEDKLPTIQNIQQDSGVDIPCLYISFEVIPHEHNTDGGNLNTANIQLHGTSPSEPISHIAMIETVLNPNKESPDRNRPKCLSDCVEHEVKNESFTFNQSKYNDVDDVNMTTAATSRRRGRYQGSVTPDFVLFLPFLLIAVARSFYASSTSLADAVTYTVLGPSSYKWGQQRLWGTIGTAVAVIAITVSDDQLKGEKFAALFFVCFGLSVMAALVGGLKLRADKFPRSNSFWADVTRIVSDGATRLFLSKLVFYGMMCGAATNFFMWFMVDLGSNQINLGLVVLVHCLSSVVCLRCSPRVLKGIGRANTINIVLAIYAIRYLAFSFLTSPWLALPVELLHGVTYSMFWAAASSTASVLAPTGTQATYQSIAGAVYWDFGRGLGTLITGQILDVIGAPWTFRAYGVTCALVIPVIFLLDRRWPIVSHQKNVYIVKEDEATGAEGDTEPANVELLNTDNVVLTTEDELRNPSINEEMPHKLTTFPSPQWINTSNSLGNGTSNRSSVLLSEKADGGSKYDRLTFRPMTDTCERFSDNTTRTENGNVSSTIHTENGDVKNTKDLFKSRGSVGVLDNEYLSYPYNSDRQIPHPGIIGVESSGMHFVSRVSTFNSSETIEKRETLDASAACQESRDSLQISISSSHLDHGDVDLSYGGSFENDKFFMGIRPKSDSLIPNLSYRNLDSDASGDYIDEHFLTSLSTVNPGADITHQQFNTPRGVEPRDLAFNDNLIKGHCSAHEHVTSVSEPSLPFKYNTSSAGAVYGSADQILSGRKKDLSVIYFFQRDPKVEAGKSCEISADKVQSSSHRPKSHIF
ncbi:unnamed protein product [Lymnaea stagnalis]|uniref:Major facilitator superfamily associated domain-containing protein n=1 Tax=Lymnaea stagnalis TaxID=6523 RepID=A0AAV2GZK5_LYMST